MSKNYRPYQGKSNLDLSRTASEASSRMAACTDSSGKVSCLDARRDYAKASQVSMDVKREQDHRFGK